MNLREHILNCDDRRFRDVPCPEWDCKVRVTALDDDAREELQYQYLKRGESSNGDPFRGYVGFMRYIVVATAQNEDGTPLFQPEDVEILKNKNGAAINRLATVAMELNGFTNEDVDELEKKIKTE